MLFKLSVKILFIAVELFLGIYSMVLSDSLLVKFIFFAVTAVMIAFIVTKLIDKLLPADKDYISTEQEEENDVQY
ncbi:hypothetical protein [Autumnicola edwardsiae]|jgi:membrane protein implicated in regulation of membrane protease activity|uniref:Uncharacterized protein n=1 Tax=Autumnicola edwardsiae TaxID=3075594 RepID=A0ABU3CVV1_9FLAO|nr:hypothetical protein [Zunongwangia sp. F297]MDT0650475.1 hypothetical protein [Zunongwangia sp. F297]